MGRGWLLRTGRKLDRTLYLQPGPEPSAQDCLIGMLDPRWSGLVAHAYNAWISTPGHEHFWEYESHMGDTFRGCPCGAREDVPAELEAPMAEAADITFPCSACGLPVGEHSAALVGSWQSCYRLLRRRADTAWQALSPRVAPGLPEGTDDEWRGALRLLCPPARRPSSGRYGA